MVKKILYINLTARMSGAEKSLLGLMAGLDRKKFQPVLLLPETGAFLGEATANGIETIILPSLIKFGEFYQFWKIPKMFRAVLKLKKIIREKEISLVHSNTPRAAYMGGLAARICRIPHFTHVRD
ncbi:MAG: glycosyltransferase, partial [Candidatus Aminicenantes bacterium]|nr:glycosyltransferase [Candidatus Aminicenantes bacterium]